jgi:hypothetical protein
MGGAIAAWSLEFPALKTLYHRCGVQEVILAEEHISDYKINPGRARFVPYAKDRREQVPIVDNFWSWAQGILDRQPSAILPMQNFAVPKMVEIRQMKLVREKPSFGNTT